MPDGRGSWNWSSEGDFATLVEQIETDLRSLVIEVTPPPEVEAGTRTGSHVAAGAIVLAGAIAAAAQLSPLY